MSGVLTFLTSRRTTFVAVLTGITLLVADQSVIVTLHDLGIAEVVTAKFVALGKLVSLGLAALGYSPLKRPKPEDGVGP